MPSVAVDAGTSVVKAVLYDDAGRPLRVARRGVDVVRPRPGHAEQDAGQVWAALTEVIVEVTAELDLAGRPVDLLSLTAQGDGLWLVDERGDAVGPAVLWSDGRANDLVTRWMSDGTLTQARARNGLLLFPGSPAAVLSWLVKHDPDRLAAAAHLTSCSGFLYGRLTGTVRQEVSDASHPFLDLASGRYDPRVLDLFDAGSWLPKLPPVVTAVGSSRPLSRAAAAALGLPAGLPVVQAPYDVPATAIGCGCTRPGDTFAALGTALVCGSVLAAGSDVDRPGEVIRLGMDDLLMEFHPTLTGSALLAWTAATLGLPAPERVMELAATVAPAAGQPVVLPYFAGAGERAPFLDPQAPGGLVGLTFDTSRADIARAVVDALGAVVLDCVGPGASLHTAGGAATSDVWCQVVADATGRVVRRPADAEAGARGAMVCGRVAVGEFPDVTAAVGALPVATSAFEPDPSRQAHYQALLERLRELRTVLR